MKIQHSFAKYKIRKEKCIKKVGPQFVTKAKNQKTPDSSPKIRISEVNYIKSIKDDTKNEFSQNKNPFCHFNSSKFIECNESAIKANEDSCSKSTYKTMEQLRNLISEKKFEKYKGHNEINKQKPINFRQTPTAKVFIMQKSTKNKEEIKPNHSSNQIKINSAKANIKSNSKKVNKVLKITDKSKKCIPPIIKKEENISKNKNKNASKKLQKLSDSNKENNKNIMNGKEHKKQVEKYIKNNEFRKEYEETPRIKTKINLLNNRNISKRLEEIIMQSKSSNIQPIIEITQINDSASTSKISSLLKLSKNGSENSIKKSQGEFAEKKELFDFNEESYLFYDLKLELKKIYQEVEYEQHDNKNKKEEKKIIGRRSKSERKK